MRSAKKRHQYNLWRLAQRGFLVLSLSCCCWFLLLIAAAAPSPENTAPSPPAAIAKYSLQVPAEVAQRQIKLTPPATKLRVTTQPGDVAVRCGDRIQTYTCTGGKPLTIERSPAEAISQFRVQNPTHAEAISIELTVYATATPPET
ncbi:MAG: hypothetical protein HC838_01360 [Spirulinaceae cyanobacterium RM2_2_10]|nr:hypothetical protein [Spirulinaceae cyanobacterium SM2_1_0]NJO18978.1 hypothetical protein [Spirulinaceae cyanobacterium RM2_2_10]